VTVVSIGELMQSTDPISWSELTTRNRYTAGFNWRAFAAFLIGFAPLIPGFAKSIQNSLNVGGAWKIYAFAWIFGFTISFLSYYVINKYVDPQTNSLVAEAVYPPGKGDVSPPSLDGTPVEEEVKDAIVKEKEIV
jgi:nucleobase:cation symporter-1, NCS1 family